MASAKDCLHHDFRNQTRVREETGLGNSESVISRYELGWLDFDATTRSEDKQVVPSDGIQTISSSSESDSNKVFVGHEVPTSSPTLLSQANPRGNSFRSKIVGRPCWIGSLVILAIVASSIIAVVVTHGKKAHEATNPSLQSSSSVPSSSQTSITMLSTAPANPESMAISTISIANTTIMPLITTRASSSIVPATISSSQTAEPSPTSGPSFQTSNDAVLSGTRLARTLNTEGKSLLFYQSGDGSLLYILQNLNMSWEGPSTSGHPIRIPVTDVKLGTPLTSTSNTHDNGTSYIHVFYINNSSIVQDMFFEDSGYSSWVAGDIQASNIKVPDNVDIAFTASNARRYNPNSDSTSGGMSLFLTSAEDGTIHEFTFTNNDGGFAFWHEGQDFGPKAVGSGGASLINIDNNAYLVSNGVGQTLALFHYNFTDEQPIWTHKAASPRNFYPASNTAICGSAHLLVYQDEDGAVQGMNSTGDSASAFSWGPSFEIADTSRKVMPGTSLSCWDIQATEPGIKYNTPMVLSVIYQTTDGGLYETTPKYGSDPSHPLSWQWRDIMETLP